MKTLYARSIEEAHLFLDLRGWPRVPRRHMLIEREGRLVSQYETPGRNPVVFHIPVPEARQRFGDETPSEIVSPAEFLAYADALARSVPADPHAVPEDARWTLQERLETAAEALCEVLKFIPPNHDAVPHSAFISQFDQDFRAAEPDRFRRDRLMVVHQHYRSAAARWAALDQEN